jgi:opacity protein-like surface antigen
MRIVKRTSGAALLVCSVFLAQLHGGETWSAKDVVESEPPSSSVTVTHEVDLDYSYAGEGEMEIGRDESGDVSEQSFLIRYVAVLQLEEWPLLRFGAEWRHYSFDLPANAVLPNTLQSVSLVIGADVQISDWLIRIEAQPGLYGDNHLSDDDFNVPFVIGGFYLYNTDLQFVIGMSVDLNRDYPVLPAIGVRWKIAERWLLNGILPRPRLEYELNDKLTLYAGAEFRSGSYRVDDSFGSSHDQPRLNSAWVEYTEVRAGGGVSWKVTDEITADAEVGALIYREFDFHRAGPSLENDGSAPYGQIAIRARF